MGKKQELPQFRIYKNKQERDSAVEANQKSYYKYKVKEMKDAEQFKKQLQNQKTPWNSTATKSTTPAKSPLVQKKTGGAVKRKMQTGGVAGKSPKAPMVDPKGAYTKVQQRTLGNMKKGGKVISKKK